MAEPTKVAGWWRFPVPGSMLLGALLFFLPWIDVRCSGPTGEVTLLRQIGALPAQKGPDQFTSARA